MKTRPQAKPRSRRRCGGVTLVELLITMVTTVVIMGGALAAYIYGLKMMQFTQPKFRASDDARRVTSLLIEDIRSAADVAVGDRKNNIFVRTPDSTLQTGGALRIYPSLDTNRYVIYFSDSSDRTLKRTTNNTTFSVVAEAVSNQVVFAAEDYKGKILTSYDANYTIGITLQFYQLTYPRLSIGSTNDYYDWYQLRSKATRRVIF